MRFQQELTQSFRRDEVYAVDLPVQFSPHLIAVLTVDRRVQAFSQPAGSDDLGLANASGANLSITDDKLADNLPCGGVIAAIVS